MDVIIQKIHQLTPTIRAFELVAANGTELPSFEAGAHIDVHLKMASPVSIHFQTAALKNIAMSLVFYMMPIHAVVHVAFTLNIVKAII